MQGGVVYPPASTFAYVGDSHARHATQLDTDTDSMSAVGMRRATWVALIIHQCHDVTVFSICWFGQWLLKICGPDIL